MNLESNEHLQRMVEVLDRWGYRVGGKINISGEWEIVRGPWASPSAGGIYVRIKDKWGREIEWKLSRNVYAAALQCEGWAEDRIETALMFCPVETTGDLDRRLKRTRELTA